jgi:hypothetical protein
VLRNYHSRTQAYNARYRARLRYRAYPWEKWPDTHDTTHIVEINRRSQQQKNSEQGVRLRSFIFSCHWVETSCCRNIMLPRAYRRA